MVCFVYFAGGHLFTTKLVLGASVFGGNSRSRHMVCSCHCVLICVMITVDISDSMFYLSFLLAILKPQSPIPNKIETWARGNH